MTFCHNESDVLFSACMGFCVGMELRICSLCKVVHVRLLCTLDSASDKFRLVLTDHYYYYV